MARHGENIRKRKDGRWEGRFMVYSEEREKKIYRSVYAQSYDEVRKKLNTQKNLMENAALETEGSIHLYHIKFSEMAEEWLMNIKNSRKPSTYIKYSAIYYNYIEKQFGDITLSDITDSFAEEKTFDHLSNSVCKSVYCVLNQILKFIMQKYSITMPILKNTASPARNRTVKTLTQNEQKKLISVLCREMNLFKKAILLCLLTGLRLGEICALKWSDIDLENRILTVNSTVQRLYSEGYKTSTSLIETVPKSECSRREIPLSDTVLEILSTFPNNAKYVFGKDKPLEPRTLQYQFKKILKDAELPDKNFHILRHTFSTNCIEGGTDVKSLSEMLGHSDVQITLNRYVHPSMNTKRQYMDELSKFYGQICGQTDQKSADFPAMETIFAD